MPRARDIPRFKDAASSHPLPIRAFNRVGRLLPGRRELAADAVWAAARKGALANCEPTPEARAALDRLLDSLSANVALSPVGYYSAQDDTIRLARTHLRIHRAFRESPGILATELPPPIFIVGWPRTGSTFLHQLLARDPASRSIPYWESFDPVPPRAGQPDERIVRLTKMLGLLARIEPRYNAIHPMAAESVEECVALFMNEFRTLQFDFQYKVPEYARWLIAQDQSIAYRLYRKQLQLIQSARPAGVRQVLKDPTHLVHLETLCREFPDARFVFTHRDPAAAISSICSLTAYTRALFSDDVDPVALGAEIMTGYWPTALDAARKVRAGLPAERVVDVRHPDLVRDPMGTVEHVYRALGLEWTESAREAMNRFVERQKGEQSAKHHHGLEGFGLSREAVRDRFSDECAEFEL